MDLWFIKQIFSGLFTTIVIPLTIQTQPSLINLHPKEYTQGLHYYPFIFNLYRYVGSWNVLNELSDKVCVPN